MSSREASKKAAKELLALCAKEGVKVPTDPINAAVEAGTMINATREIVRKSLVSQLYLVNNHEDCIVVQNEFKLDAALKEMIKKFGVKESASPKKIGKTNAETEKKSGRKRKSASDEDIDEDKNDKKKPRKKVKATCEANQVLADAFTELSGFEFKRGEKFKGGTWSKVAKAIRDCESDLTCGKDALKLKGVGKASAAMIDEFIETGTLEKLEEYRAGNL